MRSSIHGGTRGISAYGRGNSCADAESACTQPPNGASEQSDMLAHLFGTFTGLAVGLIVGLPRWWKGTWRSQALAGAMTLGVVLGAWGVALATP